MEFAGIEKLSLVDYDQHIACTIFTSGCNFRCPFCHNSDLVIGIPQGYIPFEEILAYLRKRQGILDGVVVSGGEPTLMPELKERISQIKALGYDVKLDTNGSNPKVLKDLLESGLVDYVAMDIKNCFKKYPLTTGVDALNVDPIKESINYLISHDYPYEFRTTLIDEFHKEDDIRQMAIELKGARKLRLQKFKDSDTVIKGKGGLHEVNNEAAQKFIEILKDSINDVALRGY